MLHVHILIQRTRVLLQRTEDVDAAKTREKRSCEHAGKRARDLSRLCFSPLIRILIYSLFHSFSILLLFFFFTSSSFHSFARFFQYTIQIYTTVNHREAFTFAKNIAKVYKGITTRPYIRVDLVRLVVKRIGC